LRGKREDAQPGNISHKKKLFLSCARHNSVL
jgi:hypothetical protein